MSNQKHPVYIFRCKMCGEIFHKPAVGLSMQGETIMVHSGWEGPPSEARHECMIEEFSYLSYGGEAPLTPLQGEADFVGYGYITDVKEENKDDTD